MKYLIATLEQNESIKGVYPESNGINRKITGGSKLTRGNEFAFELSLLHSTNKELTDKLKVLTEETFTINPLETIKIR